MPTAPPYPPFAAPPAAEQWPPPPPAPPVPPHGSVQPKPPRRGRATALVVALSLLCGGIGLEIGGALFGASNQTRTAATTNTVDTAPLPTVGSTTPAGGGAASALSADEIAAKVDPAIVDITTKLDGCAAA